ncbi:hypothetical protein HCN44_000726 [Aphidius gifuensis]|uniref:MD-2-related lipid-recognition domain-containing protein n=1 Tax=Aphidius gifuensis TaxID=684658 RepID=A0A834XRJ3_APHGI|nr:NPC intracellular cholesterol transporter 2 homolog a-like [Aphidius gifuensis]XP_044011821.1 NPC intracellular cholesterol transporter 2 homolog a-like [Aphidius gifuensis]KAF7990921.1 hypothetical protein HCN44_000726 [Aphidius gifuensis]
MYSLQVFIIMAFFVAASIQFTPYQKCKSGNAPLALRVGDCKNLPCKFKRGTDVHGEFDFNAAVDTDNLRIEVVAKALGITTNYPMPEPNACNSLINGKCPATKGDSLTYGLTMPVLKSYPKVKVHIRMQLVDKSNVVHSCFEIDAKVVS